LARGLRAWRHGIEIAAFLDEAVLWARRIQAIDRGSAASPALLWNQAGRLTNEVEMASISWFRFNELELDSPG
jgi:hypothetical protein